MWSALFFLLISLTLSADIAIRDMPKGFILSAPANMQIRWIPSEQSSSTLKLALPQDEPIANNSQHLEHVIEKGEHGNILVLMAKRGILKFHANVVVGNTNFISLHHKSAHTVVNPKEMLPTVIIDPGHGGKDCGHQNGTQKEKNITLVYARAIARILTARKICRVELTRTNDEDVPMVHRLHHTVQSYGVCYIALHTDYSSNKHTRGVNIYHTDATKRKSAAFYKDSGISEQSAALSAMLYHHLSHVTLMTQDEPKHIANTPLALLPCPGAYITVGHLSNVDDQSVLAHPTYIQYVAESIANGIAEYISTI